MNSAFTAEQWALAGAEACRLAMAAYGVVPTGADLREASDTAVWIATGKRLRVGSTVTYRIDRVRQRFMARGIMPTWCCIPGSSVRELAGEYVQSLSPAIRATQEAIKQQERNIRDGSALYKGLRVRVGRVYGAGAGP